MNPRKIVFAASFLAVTLSPSISSAQTTKFIRPYASYSINYDDNVFGLPSSQAAPALIGSGELGDLSRTTQIGVLLQKEISQQQISAKLDANSTKFQRFKQLDYEGTNLLANWEWRIGNHLDGNLGTSYVRALTPYTDFHEPAQNLRTQRRQNFEGRWRFHPTWQLRSAASLTNTEYSLISQKGNDRQEKSADLGIDYVEKSGSTFGLLYRHGTGRYPNPIIVGPLSVSNNYDQDEFKVRIDWRATGKTRVIFTGGAVSRTHADAAARDFRGGNARINVDWAITAKTSATIALWRELGVVDDLLTAYSVNRGISLAPKWLITDKVQTELQLRYETRDFRQSQAFAQTSDYGDTLKTVVWSLNYTPELHWLFQVSAFHFEKVGDARSAGFKRNGASLNAQYQF